MNERVVEAARAAGIESIPGIMTPPEVEKAMSLGCRTLEFFPAEQAGGINAANMRSYLERPSAVAVGGSWMAEKKLIVARDWRRMEELTRAALALVQIS